MTTPPCDLVPRRARGAVAALLLLNSAACAPQAGLEPDDAPARAQITAADEPTSVTDAQGTYIVEVRANGSGCPAGSWRTSISPDGQAFTTTFSRYAVEVTPSVATSVRDCQLALRLKTPSGRSFAVQYFSYSGFARLQPGVVGRQTASYYFQGAPIPADVRNRTELVGLQDADYVFVDEVDAADRVWSPCAVDRDLNVVTRLQVENGTPPSSGYMNVSAVDGENRIEVKLASRSCNVTAQSPIADAVPLAAPTDVQIDPAVIAPEQPFTVRWTPSAAPDTRYRVEVRAPASAGAALIWTSPELAGPPVTYAGPALRPKGFYQIVVVARRGSVEARSVLATVQVLEIIPSLPTASSLPAWAQPLLGSYAVRTDTFAQSPVGPILTDRRISLSEFVEVPGGLELRTRLCSKEASALGLTMYIRNPTAYPEERQRVLLSGGSWSTEAVPLANGYQREGYPGCSGRIGQRVPRRPEQTWLRTGTCMYNAPAEAPTFDDCRVTDPDHDGAPGLAYKYRGTSDAETWVAHSATISRSHYTSGTIDASGAGAHFGSLKSDETTFQLACEPGTCNVSAVVRPCTSEYNGSQFRRLSTVLPFQSKVTCDDVVAQAMMQRPALPTPSRCTRDTVSSVP